MSKPEMVDLIAVSVITRSSMEIKKPISYLSIKEIKCARCGTMFWRAANNQLYCGSLKKKTGCSYIHFREQCKERQLKRRGLPSSPSKIEYNRKYCAKLKQTPKYWFLIGKAKIPP